MEKAVEVSSGITDAILNEISKVVVGKQDAKELLLVALLSDGHVLIEGYAGSAKTLLAKTFAQVLSGKFKRVQFTPDMLPADVTGFNVYTPNGRSRFVEGPLFANVVLADELNRTTPRTQAALIEAMQEKQVTIEGVTHQLSNVFMVIGSQLPFGSEGTYPLTEVQLDRFMFRILSDYVSKEEEIQIISKVDYIEQPDIKPVASLDEIALLRQKIKAVHVSDEVKGYIIDLVRACRVDPDVLYGVSTRASVSLFKSSRAYAYLKGRDFVLPDDVKRLAFPVLAHRIRVKPEAEMDDVTAKTVVDRVLSSVPVPKI